MDDVRTLPIPEGWLESIEASDAEELNPEDLIPVEEVLEELRQAEADLRAKLAARAAAQALIKR